MRGATILLAAAALLASGAGASGAKPPSITFAARDGRLLLTTPRYRLALDAATGAIVDLLARPSGTRLVRGEKGCLWSAITSTGDAVDACPASPPAYRWDPRTATATLAFPQVTVAITAANASFDLRLTLTNASDGILSSVDFPADLLGASAIVS